MHLPPEKTERSGTSVWCFDNNVVTVRAGSNNAGTSDQMKGSPALWKRNQPASLCWRTRVVNSVALVTPRGHVSSPVWRQRSAPSASRRCSLGSFEVILFHREVLASAPLPRARSISVKVSGCPASPRELQR
jgi:hypothetical protein